MGEYAHFTQHAGQRRSARGGDPVDIELDVTLDDPRPLCRRATSAPVTR
ncbi:hypothetical protein HUT18_02105 [Streptomyces sp. NA04227]|nr:hypothetical protein [Streptomyces sp. NA04227]QKW05346.1 hypothetical protein HUT18_02105 [Streptomyces sp. NA04227]